MVSEGLNSVESSAVPAYMCHRHSVSEGLNSVESRPFYCTLCKNPCVSEGLNSVESGQEWEKGFYGDGGFRRTK